MYDPRDPRQQQPTTPPQFRQYGQPPQPYQQPQFPPNGETHVQPNVQWQQPGYQQPWPAQAPVQVNVQQNAYGPNRAVTQGKLGYFEELFHWTMILCTCGLWYPVYASRKRSKRSVTRYR